MLIFKSTFIDVLIDSGLLSIIILPIVYGIFLHPLIEAQKVLEKSFVESQKFQIAVENASDHIVITDPNGIIIFANKGVSRITGFPVSELIGKKSGSKENWGGQMSKEFYDNLWKKLKNDKSVFVGEINNVRKNGEKYTALASISPILNEKREIIYFVGVERDITKEKQIDQAKSEFVSLASHQLGTPLAAINWYAEMVLDGDAGEVNEKQKKFVQEIYNGSQRMGSLVKALLNVSRIELGTFAINPEPTDFVEIAKDLVKEMKHNIELKKINLDERYDKNLSKIQADPNLIRIVIQNLLSNAIKYTPENGLVSLVIDKKDPYIEIVVSDNGYGIPETQKDKIFTKLFRADNIREKDTEGTGLGLYIVKSIIDQSGGKVWFESEENKGTKFFVQLPLSGVKAKEGSKALEDIK